MAADGAAQMNGLASQLSDQFSSGRRRILSRCADVARGRGSDIYLVGGAVRDLLLGTAGSDPDLDIAGPGVDARFAAELADGLGGQLLASTEFGTHRLSVPDGERDETVRIDLVACRSETYAGPGALPDVAPGTLTEDLARRDFSIGAMAVVIAPAPGSGHAWGDLIDPHGGQRDIERRLVRVMHPGSFQDDPTRIFRAVRYATRLGFEIERGSEALMASGLVNIDRLSGARVRHELEHVFDEEKVARMLKELGRRGVLGAVFGGLGSDIGAISSGGSIGAVWGPDEWIGLLSSTVMPERTGELTERLNLGSGSARVVGDVAAINALGWDSRTVPSRPSEVYEALCRRSLAAVRACAAATRSAPLRAALITYIERLAGTATELSGEDLLRMGATEGPEVGRLLRQLLHARLDGEIAGIEDERAFIRSLMGQQRA